MVPLFVKDFMKIRCGACVIIMVAILSLSLVAPQSLNGARLKFPAVHVSIFLANFNILRIFFIIYSNFVCKLLEFQNFSISI